MVYCFVLNSHTLESLGNAVVKWGFGKWRYLLFLNSSREVACPDLKEGLCESIMKVLIWRCYKAKFVYAWNGNREVSWRRKYLGIGMSAVLLLLLWAVVVHWCEEFQITQPQLPLHTLVPGKVFAIRCANGSGVYRLEGPRCWAQAGMSIESCQSLCVLHFPSWTRAHFVLFLAVLSHLFTGS